MEIHEEAPPAPIDPNVTALIAAVRTSNVSEVAKLLKANAGLVNARDRAGNTALHYAAGFGSIETMKLLFDRRGM